MQMQLTFNVITTKKTNESVLFYRDIFGYEVVADIGWYKQLKHPSGVELAFMEPGHPTQPPLFQREWDGSGLILSVQVDDVRTAYKQVKAAGVPIEFDLTEEEWGQVHFAVIDPNGIPVDIVQEL
jgi:catechol 2,3-dioxygenase-like lactoylglutathione lyase family enzyme